MDRDDAQTAQEAVESQKWLAHRCRPTSSREASGLHPPYISSLFALAGFGVSYLRFCPDPPSFEEEGEVLLSSL